MSLNSLIKFNYGSKLEIACEGCDVSYDVIFFQNRCQNYL